MKKGKKSYRIGARRLTFPLFCGTIIKEQNRLRASPRKRGPIWRKTKRNRGSTSCARRSPITRVSITRWTRPRSPTTNTTRSSGNSPNSKRRSPSSTTPTPPPSGSAARRARSSRRSPTRSRWEVSTTCFRRRNSGGFFPKWRKFSKNPSIRSSPRSTVCRSG